MALAGQGAQALAFASSGLTSFALQAACVGGGRFLASIASGEATSRATSSAPGSTQGSVTARTATSASLEHGHADERVQSGAQSGARPLPLPTVQVTAAEEIQSLAKKRYGIAKKLALKVINKKLVLRFLARRLSIAVPVYGLYSGSKLLRNDIRRSIREADDGLPEASRAFAACAFLDLIDVSCQTVVLSSLMVSLFGAGIPVHPALVGVCDKMAISASVISTAMGLYGEHVALHRLYPAEATEALANIARGLDAAPGAPVLSPPMEEGEVGELSDAEWEAREEQRAKAKAERRES